MDDEGAFKTALRGGRWVDWKQMLAESVNEQLRFRAAYQGARGGEEWFFDASEYELVDPATRAERAAEEAERAEEQALAQKAFEEEIGFS